MRAEPSIRARAVQATSDSLKEHSRAVSDLDHRLRILLRYVLPPKAGGLIPASGMGAAPAREKWPEM
jgi:hypothetical protein